MDNRLRSTFLMLVLAQGLHSIEEYMGKLWEVLPMAEFLTGLVSKDHETGFLVIIIGLFIVGLICWLLLRKNHASVSGLVWFWIAIELVNGFGHPIWAISEGTYVPGLVTAPILLILTIALLKFISASNSQRKTTVL